MNPRQEALLREAQSLRRMNYENQCRIKVLAWLALSGWVLFVGVAAMVPA